PRVVAPASSAQAHTIVAAALRDGARVDAAIAGGERAVGLIVTAPLRGEVTSGPAELLSLGVAPAWRRQGLATRLLGAHSSPPDPVPGPATLNSIATVGQ